VAEAQSFNALAGYVYGDAQLGPAVAALGGLPYDPGVPPGSVLQLPPKKVVEQHAEAIRKVDSLVKGARKASDKGDFGKAAEKYAEALAVRPERTDLLVSLGMAQLQAGDLDAAAVSLERAAQALPDDPEARYALGSLLRRQGNLPRARREYRAALGALSEGENHPRLTYEYALTLADLGENEEAREIFQQFIYEFPSDPFVDDARSRLEQLDAPSAP
jgi:tetratricopeptide (TPR) repeat protein